MKFIDFNDLKNMLIIIVVIFLVSSFMYTFSSFFKRVENLESSFDKYICRECGSLKNK